MFFVVIGLALAFVLIAIFSRRGTRNCRWRAERSGDRGTLRKYRCAACGAEAFTATSGPPTDCKAGLGPPKL
ncbi:hypothetical protein SAMN05421688_3441 [Poseidonocella pacifica]|uniref:Uncharacterized protein n=1 Tax=Poseidonocella pacifica TaxID=871651 RepID=A0A1I0YZQ6_9RHOB|nr:hypothetical protein [Poseidonocella pacifica]SFB17850.1 hypothetical protein SAMN05421688_3441 [Poseidonocella pacifica]